MIIIEIQTSCGSHWRVIKEWNEDVWRMITLWDWATIIVHSQGVMDYTW